MGVTKTLERRSAYRALGHIRRVCGGEEREERENEESELHVDGTDVVLVVNEVMEVVVESGGGGY